MKYRPDFPARFGSIVADKLIQRKQYINEHGEDMPEIRNWKWATPA